MGEHAEAWRLSLAILGRNLAAEPRSDVKLRQLGEQGVQLPEADNGVGMCGHVKGPYHRLCLNNGVRPPTGISQFKLVRGGAHRDCARLHCHNERREPEIDCVGPRTPPGAPSVQPRPVGLQRLCCRLRFGQKIGRVQRGCGHGEAFEGLERAFEPLVGLAPNHTCPPHGSLRIEKFVPIHAKLAQGRPERHKLLGRASRADHSRPKRHGGAKRTVDLCDVAVDPAPPWDSRQLLAE